MDESEQQLQADLLDSVTRSLQQRRPLLTHLNADTTWLLSIPIPQTSISSSPYPSRPNGSSRKHQRKLSKKSHPQHAEKRKDPKKTFFHILIDPWLQGSQSDVAPFFSQQWHSVTSAVQTVPEVEDVITGIEELASGSFSSKTENLLLNHTKQSVLSNSESTFPIDAIIVSHEFTDHMHKETLLEIASAVPVFATAKAAAIIQSWGHFDTVISMPSFVSRDPDWRHISVAPLPPWLGIARIASEAKEMLYYHSAIMVVFSSQTQNLNLNLEHEHTNTAEAGEQAEALLYTPHGISPPDLLPLTLSHPPIRTLALLHGLHDIKLTRGAQLNLGAHNGLTVQRLTHAKYWVGTHDEVKRGGGLVSWFLRREVVTVGEALEKEIRKEGSGEEEVRFVELGNGESLVLE